MDTVNLTIDMKDVEARYVLRKIELLLRGYENNKSNNITHSAIFAKTLNDIYSNIAGYDCPSKIQDHLDLRRVVTLDIDLSRDQIPMLLLWINQEMIYYEPYFLGGMPRDFNALFMTPLNDLYKEILGKDHPAFVQNHFKNCNLFMEQLKRMIEKGLLNQNPEYLALTKREIETVGYYLQDMSPTTYGGK